MPRPLVIGHRGAPGYRPEPSRSSYELALAQGVDAVEPDVVVSRDGVLVVRHENEISGTTDVAERPEFADRRTTKTIDGVAWTGWFVEDFVWDELSTLRCRERLPDLRPDSAAHDDGEPVLCLRNVLDLVRDRGGGRVGVVLEIKHATYFASLGWDVASLVVAELAAAGWTDGTPPLTVESFEPTVLTDLHERGLAAASVLLLDASGKPADLVARDGSAAPTFASFAELEGLDRLVGAVDGISVHKRMLLASNALGHAGSSVVPALNRPRVVVDAHARGLSVFTWTCRPENAFLTRRFRTGGGRAAHGDWRAEWTLLRDAGVDGVFVDHPDLGVEVFRA